MRFQRSVAETGASVWRSSSYKRAKKASSRTAQTKGGDMAKIYVGNLAYEFEPRDLEEEFARVRTAPTAVCATVY